MLATSSRDGIFNSCRGIMRHDIQKAIYLLPYLVLNVVCHGSKEATPVDTDSSISNCCNLSGECGGRFADGKEVEVIDLENDSGPEYDASSNSERDGKRIHGAGDLSQPCTEYQ